MVCKVACGNVCGEAFKEVQVGFTHFRPSNILLVTQQEMRCSSLLWTLKHSPGDASTSHTLPTSHTLGGSPVSVTRRLLPLLMMDHRPWSFWVRSTPQQPDSPASYPEGWAGPPVVASRSNGSSLIFAVFHLRVFHRTCSQTRRYRRPQGVQGWWKLAGHVSSDSFRGDVALRGADSTEACACRLVFGRKAKGKEKGELWKRKD